MAATACVVGYVFLISLMRGSPHDIGLVVPAFVVALAMVGLNKTFFRAEGESLAIIGLDAPGHRLRQFGAAFLAGSAVASAWAAILWVAVSPRWEPYDGFLYEGAISRVAFCVFNNAAEELAYRGYLLWKLGQQFGPTVAVLSTSALFALLHVQAGVPWASAVTIIFTSGVLFTA